MLRYNSGWVELLATRNYLRPLSLAVGAAPNDDAAKHLPVLNAFMEPLVGLYRRLSPRDMPSDEKITEAAIKVACDIAAGFADKVRSM